LERGLCICQRVRKVLFSPPQEHNPHSNNGTETCKLDALYSNGRRTHTPAAAANNKTVNKISAALWEKRDQRFFLFRPTMFVSDTLVSVWPLLCVCFGSVLTPRVTRRANGERRPIDALARPPACDIALFLSAAAA
jgi:hypothetical protein